MNKNKEYILILGFWIRHTEDKKHYFRFNWDMVSTLVKYIIKGKKIYFTVVKSCGDRQDYFVEFLIKNKEYKK